VEYWNPMDFRFLHCREVCSQCLYKCNVCVAAAEPLKGLRIASCNVLWYLFRSVFDRRLPIKIYLLQYAGLAWPQNSLKRSNHLVIFVSLKSLIRLPSIAVHAMSDCCLQASCSGPDEGLVIWKRSRELNYVTGISYKKGYPDILLVGVVLRTACLSTAQHTLCYRRQSDGLYLVCRSATLKIFHFCLKEML
jgi:hypothetical protein